MNKSVLLLAIMVCALAQAEEVKQVTFVPRDAQGYPCVRSIEDVCRLYPKTVKDVQERSAVAQKEALKLIDGIIVCLVEKQNKETMLYALDRVYAWIDSTRHPINTIGSVHSDEALRNECVAQYIVLNNFITEQVESNKALYKVFKSYHDTNAQKEVLTTQERYFLKTMLSTFERAGLGLSDHKSAQLMKLKKRCMELEAQFQKNLNDDTSKLIVSKEQLAGMSEEFIAGLSREGEFYVLLASEHYWSVMYHCSVEATRKTFYCVFNKRAYPVNAEITKELLEVRHKRAKLLGYKSFAEFDLANQMIQSPEKAAEFLKDIHMRAAPALQKKAEEAVRDLSAEVSLTQEGKIQVWNSYYKDASSEKQKVTDAKVDAVKTEEYFPLDQTLIGLMKVYEQFFSIIIEKIPTGDVWHQDVQLLRISTKDKQVAQYVFLDLFRREKKVSYGYILWDLDGVKKLNEPPYPGVATVICNFTKPRTEKPALLGQAEIFTLFHELGHAVHSALARTQLCYQAGIKNVTYDFLEVPSQLAENWAGDRDILKMISCHYKTGQVIPEVALDDLVKTARCRDAVYAAHLAFYGLFLLELHGKKRVEDVEQINKKWRDLFYPYLDYGDEYHDYCALTHLGRENYGPKIYSYIWSVALACDLFEQIEKEGLLNPVAGRKYVDAILSCGGSKDANDMLRDYLGREPRFDAFYKKMGL